MKGTVNILEGSTFVTSDERGDIDGTPVTPHGLFALDTRFLSRWRLTVDGQSPAVLSTDDLHYYAAQFFVAPSTGSTYVDSPVSIVRRRSIAASGMHEDIRVMNHTPERRTLALRLEVAADFADLFEVKDALEKKGKLYSRVEDARLVLGYQRDEYVRETLITAQADGVTVGEDAIEFRVELPPNGRWEASLDVVPSAPGLPGPPASPDRGEGSARLGLKEWQERAPRLECDWRHLERAYDKSLADLAALRLEIGPSRTVVPAAGLPWFMSLFGRDSIITSYQALPFVPELARMTLDALANLQGSRLDNFRDEEPGKICHELRFGEMTAFEERPHSPYYGAADSTALWLILLDEYERWSGHADVVKRLEPAARAALEWIDRHGDRDGDGYIEYERRNTESGLENQCWKDSWNSILYRDGRLASLPRATCELQGYAYDAKVRCARLAREIWGDEQLGEQLEQQAAALKERFNRDFWIEEQGYYALALDGEKKQVDSLTSNIGHLMWSGIVDEDRAARCVEQLMGPRLFSGWGVRTMARGEGGYNPIGYHVGTVWPHDNSIIAMGLRRYGYGEEAARIAQAMIEASSFFNYRLPEAFAGYDRNETHYPAEYPTACSPQAWATGTPLLLVRAILGLEPNGALLEVNAVPPDPVSRLQVSGIPGRWGTTDAGVDATDSIVGALGAAAAAAPAAVRELFTLLGERIVPGLSKTVHKSIRFDLTDGGSWRIAADNGRLAVEESTEEADCILEMTEDTLLRLLTGEQNARTAALSGKVKVRGDLDLASRFGRLVTAGRPDGAAQAAARNGGR